MEKLFICFSLLISHLIICSSKFTYLERHELEEFGSLWPSTCPECQNYVLTEDGIRDAYEENNFQSAHELILAELDEQAFAPPTPLPPSNAKRSDVKIDGTKRISGPSSLQCQCDFIPLSGTVNRATIRKQRTKRVKKQKKEIKEQLNRSKELSKTASIGEEKKSEAVGKNENKNTGSKKTSEKENLMRYDPDEPEEEKNEDKEVDEEDAEDDKEADYIDTSSNFF